MKEIGLFFKQSWQVPSHSFFQLHCIITGNTIPYLLFTKMHVIERIKEMIFHMLQKHKWIYENMSHKTPDITNIYILKLRSQANPPS